MKPLIERRKKKRTKSQNCATQNLTALLRWVSTPAQGRADLFCIVPTPCSRRDMLTLSVSFQYIDHQIPMVFDKHQNCPGHERFRRIRQEAHRNREHKNQRPRVARARRKNDVLTNNVEKQGQRRIIESREIRQVHSTRRAEVNCRNRDLLTEDVCSCLACSKTFPRSSQAQKETRRCHSYFMSMISPTSSENDTLVLSFHPSAEQFRSNASVVSKHRAVLTSQTVPLQRASPAKKRKSLSSSVVRSSNLFRELEGSPR